jgi:hypothetical protein
MTICSKIAWTALSCVLLSSAVNAADQVKPTHDRDAHGKRIHDKHGRVPNPGVDPTADAPATGAAATTPEVTAPAALPTLLQLGCLVEHVGSPPVDKIELTNSTASPVPAGTVVWIGPPRSYAVQGVIFPLSGASPDGTAPRIDRYVRLSADLSPGGTYRPDYSPNPSWQSCTAAIGMASLLSAVQFVQ